MASAQPFIDYYKILQVSPNCDARILESAYRHLAKMYHPDHTGAADTTKLNEVIHAYRALRNPDERAHYDRLYASNVGQDGPPPSSNAMEIDDQAALSDADAHEKILMSLYERRRENAQNAGVIGFYLQEMLKCSDEHFEFHKWYLKEKGFIAITEQGTLAITIEGVDHLISRSRTTRAEKLLLERSENPHG
jgi:curved DNA-binding protein